MPQTAPLNLATVKRTPNRPLNIPTLENLQTANLALHSDNNEDALLIMNDILDSDEPERNDVVSNQEPVEETAFNRTEENSTNWARNPANIIEFNNGHIQGDVENSFANASNRVEKDRVVIPKILNVYSARKRGPRQPLNSNNDYSTEGASSHVQFQDSTSRLIGHSNKQQTTATQSTKSNRAASNKKLPTKVKRNPVQAPSVPHVIGKVIDVENEELIKDLSKGGVITVTTTNVSDNADTASTSRSRGKFL